MMWMSECGRQGMTQDYINDSMYEGLDLKINELNDAQDGIEDPI